MLNWLKTYWPALLLGLMIVAVVGGTLSSLLSCHPKGVSSAAHDECTALHGPIFVSIKWLLHGLHRYEGSFTALFTVVLALFTGRLWFSTEKLFRATKLLVEGADNTARHQLRAYVGVKSIGFEKPLSPLHPVEIKILIVNFGNTPALNYQTDIRLSLRENPLQTPFIPKMRNFIDGGGDTLMPGSESAVICVLDFGNQSAATPIVQGIWSGQLAVYAEGQIGYNDVFGNPRYTNIRKLASGNRIATGSPLINCNEGNDSN